MSEIYQSTMALSVYNVLSLSKVDLPIQTIDKFLRAAFDHDLADDYVTQGAEYLIANALAREDGGVLKIERLADGRGKPVVRSGDDRELVKAAY